jgi:hypothetical protein
MSPPVATTHVRVSLLGLAQREKLIGETKKRPGNRHGASLHPIDSFDVDAVS